MIETDSKYYFDKRVPMHFQSILSILIGPIWLIGFLLIIQIFAEFRYPAGIFIVIFLLGLLVGIINTFINKNSILNVFVIDKSWISDNYEEGGETVLKGVIPTGGASYLLSHVLEEKLDNKVLKIFPKNIFYNTSFTIKYKMVA